MALAKGMSAIEAAADKAVRGIVESHGFTLWDVVFIKEGAGWYLWIYIDKPGGVNIDDVESVNDEINEAIDKQDFIDRIDYLEISSAGLERAVRRVDQLALSVGRKIRLRTYKLCEGLPAKTVNCVLDAVDGERVTVSGDFGSAALEVSDISAVNYDDFNDFDKLMEE